MIRTEELGKRFRDKVAVKGLSLEIPTGEVFGLLGPNGAGKTTTVRMLTALIAPTAGRAWVNGHEIGREDDRVRASVGILTETPGLYARLDAVQNLRLFAKLHALDDIGRRVERYLRLLGLWERRRDPVGTFSKGMQQKLAIARALLHEPPVVFLDEPTAGLDPESARVVRDFVGELSGQGRTVLLCTHNLDEADRLCNRIGVLKQHLLHVDTPEGLRRGLYGRHVIVRLCNATPSHLEVVRALPFVKSAAPRADGLRVTLDNPEVQNPILVRALVEAGAEVQFVEEEAHSLEEAYFALLGDRGKAEPS
jgi:ABC-2 type transport system ATP-binding protein